MNTARPEWVVLGGCCIAFLAAALNITFMMQLGTSVSHLTGDLSRFSTDLVAVGPDAAPVRNLAVAIAGFLCGAVLSGFFIHHPTIDISRPYGRSITFIGCLVVASYLALPRSGLLAVLLASTACGFQNALASKFRGIILRTTHITGLLTDLGICLGMKAKGHEVESWKIALPALLIASFFLGSVTGAFGAIHGGTTVTLYLGLAYLLGGLSWSAFKHLVLGKAAAPVASVTGEKG